MKYDLSKFPAGGVPAKPSPAGIICERCGKGPHDDGFPPIRTISEAIDLGWSRTSTGVLDEECASEVIEDGGNGLLGYD